VTAPRRQDGYSLIELCAVIVLLGIFAGFSFQLISSGTELYVSGVRNRLEVFTEGSNALEKMVREIREAAPDDVVIGTNSVSIVKSEGVDGASPHVTQYDPELEITFAYDAGDQAVVRQSATGNYNLTEDVASFTPSQDENGVVTLDLVLEKGESQIHLRTAVFPRQ